MPWGFAAAAAATVVSGYMASESAEDAAYAQSQSARGAQDETRRQFEVMRNLLKPYVEAGGKGLAGQLDLLGLGDPMAQKQAISALEQGPSFLAQLRQGENAMLQNASATGGLRGGNIQGALAQFRPALLANEIERQYAKLGQLSQMGQNSAAFTGSGAMNTGAAIAGLAQQQGAAEAGGILGRSAGQQRMLSGLGQGFGGFSGGSSGDSRWSAWGGRPPSIYGTSEGE